MFKVHSAVLQMIVVMVIIATLMTIYSLLPRKQQLKKNIVEEQLIQGKLKKKRNK